MAGMATNIMAGKTPNWEVLTGFNNSVAERRFDLLEAFRPVPGN